MERSRKFISKSANRLSSAPTAFEVRTWRVEQNFLRVPSPPDARLTPAFPQMPFRAEWLTSNYCCRSEHLQIGIDLGSHYLPKQLDKRRGENALRRVCFSDDPSLERGATVDFDQPNAWKRSVCNGELINHGNSKPSLH